MPTAWILTLILGAVAALLAVVGSEVGRRREPPRGVLYGVLFTACRVYARAVHRVRYEYEDGALDEVGRGPLIIVCNHTAGIDPLLVSLGLPWHIRWIMARDMMLPWLGWFWRWTGVISIARDGSGRRGLRRAHEHLGEGGVIGIFPEGRIERPQCTLLPFATGVGMLVKRTNARVLPVVIDGTPYAPSAWASVWMPSRARVRVKRPIEYAEMDISSVEITRDLESRFASWTGWERGPKGDTPGEGAQRVPSTMRPVSDSASSGTMESRQIA